MARQYIDVTVSAHASRYLVYELLQDGTTWPGWSPIGSFTLEREGRTEREGIGAIRVFRTGRVTSREEIVELIPGRRFSYVLLSGLAVRNLRADIDLVPDIHNNTTIRWRASFNAKVPGTGRHYRELLRRFIYLCARGLAGHATTQTSRRRLTYPE